MAEEYEYTCDDDILCGVNVPKDASNLRELEEKHLPVITAPDTVNRNQSFEVTIEVGKYRKQDIGRVRSL